MTSRVGQQRGTRLWRRVTMSTSQAAFGVLSMTEHVTEMERQRERELTGCIVGRLAPAASPLTLIYFELSAL